MMPDVIETKRLTGTGAGIAVAIACAVAFAPGAGARATKPSQVDVVGSGTIAWSRLAVLAKPKPGRGPGRRAEAVSPGLPPAVRSRARRRADEVGEADVVPDQRPGAAERAHGLGASGRARAPSGPQARDHLPRRAQVRVLGRRAARPLGKGGGRRTGRGDAARALLRHRQVRPGDRPRLGDPRRLTRSRRARTRSSPTGRAAASSACTERPGRTSSARRSRTAAFGSTTATSSSCATASRSGRRSRSSASRKARRLRRIRRWVRWNEPGARGGESTEARRRSCADRPLVPCAVGRAVPAPAGQRLGDRDVRRPGSTSSAISKRSGR